MARLQYQRSAKPGGYRPQTQDDTNIARLRQETTRQIEGMRQAASAEIENRREVSRMMQEDAAATSRQLERNYQIQTQNTDRELRGLQAQATRDQQQFNIDQQANKAIFESLATLSGTAAKTVNALQKKQEDEDYEKDTFTPTTVDEDIANRNQELLMRSADLNRLTGIEIAEINGADPLAATTLKLESPALGFDAAAGHFNQYANEQHEDSRAAFFRAAEERVQRPLTYEEKKQLLGLHTAGVVALARDAGVSPRFLKRIMGTIQQKDNAFLSVERKRKLDADNEILVDKSLNNVLHADPTRRNEVFITSFRNVSSVKGPEEALNLFQKKVFTAINPKTGKPYMSDEEIAQLPFFQNGVRTTMAEKYSDKQGNPTGRYAEIQSERIKVDLEWRKQQIDAEKISNAETEQALFRAFQANPTAKNAEEAQRMYVSLTGKESTMLKNASKHLTNEAQHNQNVISAVTKLRDFELTPEIVSAAVAANPTEGAAIKQRYEAYNAKWKSESYKDANKSLETVVSGTTSFGTTKAAEAGSLPMIGHLKAELRNRTAMYEPALGFEAAHQKAAGELANEYRNGYRNKDSKFYRKVSRNGTVSYPNLPVGNVSAAEQIKRDITNLRTSVKTIGVEGVLDTPLSVTSAERLEYIKKNFYKDDFKPTPKELAFIGMSKGMPLHEAYNRFFQANGDSFRLQSPLRLNGQELTLTPEDKKILGDPTKGRQAKLAVINKVLNPGMFQTAQSMRPGSPFLVYTAGNIGPTSTGPHLDVKQVGGAQFAPSALDNYIEVDDPELGVVPLSRVPITGDFASHTARGSHGIDYGLYSGTKIYAKNGARVISNTPTEHGDKLLIQLPDGKQYTFLHGTAAK